MLMLLLVQTSLPVKRISNVFLMIVCIESIFSHPHKMQLFLLDVLMYLVIYSSESYIRKGLGTQCWYSDLDSND